MKILVFLDCYPWTIADSKVLQSGFSMKKKSIAQNLGKQSGITQPPVEKALQAPAQCSQEQVLSSPNQSRTTKVWNSNTSSDPITSPLLHITAHPASLWGQWLPWCQRGWHLVPRTRKFGRRIPTSKTSRAQGRYSAGLRKKTAGSPAIERRNKAGRGKFSAVSNCSLHKSILPNLSVQHFFKVSIIPMQKRECSGLRELPSGRSCCICKLSQCLYMALVWVVSRCYWSFAVKYQSASELAKSISTQAKLGLCFILGFFFFNLKPQKPLLKGQQMTNRTRVKCVISKWGQPNFELAM